MIKGYYIDENGKAIEVYEENKTKPKSKPEPETKVDNRELSVICFTRMINIEEYQKRNGVIEPELTKTEKIREVIINITEVIIGLLMIFGTVYLCNSGFMYDELAHCNDWTAALITIPLGIFVTVLGIGNLIVKCH